ncbi:GcrA family cell cycle regulator [Lichenihabitans sp. PAMC28606]|uniref:GcrA family cell cycle regulator n=1 Tax=Lichenihabitans sp. PAMC28606 TaxID=2880932 RepID=UPI001D0A5AC4|nr:GcrA family cell cycle regulator [Lichenihabitans sp. PAMC28606]
MFEGSPAANVFKNASADGCHYPIGDLRQEGFRFGSAPVEAVGKPYCAGHAQRCYVPSSVRRPAKISLARC